MKQLSKVCIHCSAHSTLSTLYAHKYSVCMDICCSCKGDSRSVIAQSVMCTSMYMYLCIRVVNWQKYPSDIIANSAHNIIAPTIFSRVTRVLDGSLTLTALDHSFVLHFPIFADAEAEVLPDWRLCTLQRSQANGRNGMFNFATLQP